MSSNNNAPRDTNHADQQGSGGHHAGQGGSQNATPGGGQHGTQDGSQPNAAAQGGQPRSGGSTQRDQPWWTNLAGWFSEAILRVTVAFIGIALVLLAAGQLLGLELFSMFADVLTSAIGQWLIVAFIGLLLIIAASKHWGLAQSWQ